MKNRPPVILLALLCLATLGQAPRRDHASQVVEVAVTYQRYEARRPWAKSRPRTRSAMAVVVEGQLLLTTAQMVGDATLVQVKKFGGPPKVAARIVHMDREVNLALLTVDEPGFFDDLHPVRLADALPTDGSVLSVRWSRGQLEVSRSRVASIEVRSSHTGHLEHAFLRVKSDLAGGGWVEPVFDDGRLVGLTASQDDDLANVLPGELIRTYLGAVQADDGYRGFGNLGVAWQVNRDRALASYLGLEGEPRGVLILQVPWGSSACGTLEPRDVLLELDGQAIDAEGFYRHAEYGRLRFTHLVADGHLAGDALPARVLRDGAVRDLTLTLRRYPVSALLIPWRQSDRAPPYLVAGGLVFRELDVDYLASWGRDWRNKADTRLVARWELDMEAQTPRRRRVIILMYVLPDPYNIGYHDLENLVVREVNGLLVDSLSDVEEGFRHPEAGFHRITFQPNEVRSEVVLDAAAFESATAAILRNYGIPEWLRLTPDPPPDPDPPCPGEL